MRRWVRVVGIGFSLLLVLAGVGIWNTAFRAPSSHLLPVPNGLIAVESSPGKELLAEKGFIADYESLTTSAFETDHGFFVVLA